MFGDEFDARAKADMEVALQRACSHLANDKADMHEIRRFIADRILSCARDGQTSLTELTAAGRRAVIELSARWK